MAIYCAIYEDSDYWDGTIAWGYDATSDVHTPTAHANQGARDGQYTAAFTAVATWEETRDGVGSGDDEYGIVIGPWDNSDVVEEMDIGDWTDANSITLRGIGDARFKGLRDNGANGPWRSEHAETKQMIEAGASNFTLDGLQFINTEVTDTSNSCLYFYEPGTYVIENCWFQNDNGSGIRLNDALATFTVTNCVVARSGTGTNTGQDGIHADDATNHYIQQCTIYGWPDEGINRDAGTCDVENCIVFGNGDDFHGTFNTISYCASDDGNQTDGTNIEPAGDPGDWANEMSGYAAYDFELDGSGNCINIGNNDPLGDGTGSPSANGETRSNWDCGMWEKVVAGPSGAITVLTTAYLLKSKQEQDGEHIPGLI